MAYTYPENRLEIIDGSLRPVSSVPEDVVLIVERAHKGPSNTVYLVSDMTLAGRLFGENSPLIELANRTRAARAENIALFRIGGGSYEYLNIFGEGTSLTLTEQSLAAADNIKVFIGAEPKSPGRQCVIVYEGEKIIYSNVLGAEVYSNKVQVNGFNKATNDITVGTFKDPVPFKDVITKIGAEESTKASLTPKQVEVESAQKIAVPVTDITGFNPDEDDFDLLRFIKQDTKEVVPHTVSKDKTNIIFNDFVDGVSEPVNTTTTLDAKFVKKESKDKFEKKGIVYNAGKDSMNATNQQLFEEYDKALAQLELIPTKALVVGDLFGVPNVAEGSKDPNALKYLEKGEDEVGNPTYTWADKKYVYRQQGTTDQETTDIAQAEIDLNGKPVILKQYGEVDFVHRLGMFAYNKTFDGHFVNIIIGAKGPANTSPRAVADWIGYSPKYDFEGNIVENGKGLLGHRLMVGTTDYRGGYFATANGYVDGEPLVDMTGFPVDLGKHISIIASQVGSASNPRLVTSGAAAYGGLVSRLGPGQSTTNQAVPNLFLKVDFKEEKRRALANAGYVVFVDKPKGLTVYSGDLATRENSDYDYISTAITVSQVAKLITDVTDPFIGQGLDLVTMTALQTSLTTALANAQREGWFISYQFKIRRDGYNTLLIPYIIEAKDELRQVRNVVRLTRDTNFIEL